MGRHIWAYARKGTVNRLRKPLLHSSAGKSIPHQIEELFPRMRLLHCWKRCHPCIFQNILHAAFPAFSKGSDLLGTSRVEANFESPLPLA